jgi:HEAT repeat protein
MCELVGLREVWIADMASREIEELFERAMTNDDDDESWKAIDDLRTIGTREVFERAVELCRSGDFRSRACGVTVLCQLGRTIKNHVTAFADESYSIITEMARTEAEADALASEISALGHLGNPGAIPLIAGASSHPNSEVRFAVACALGSFPNEPRSVETLLVLMEDVDADVRDWSTFGLGVLGDADSIEIREAFVRRLSDADEDAREEAMVGLGKRQDQRVLPVLLAVLEQPKLKSPRAIEAASGLLGMKDDPEDWKGMDYAGELRRRFSL